MNDFLFSLFYQVIGAVNAAVILSAIVWLAKRKDEKDGRKPNQDFTPPPTKHSDGYQPKPSGMPKPPTTGTNVIEPKKHKYDKFSCFCAPFCNLTREQVLDGLDRYIKGFSSNDLLDRVENEIRERTKDDQRTGTQTIQSFFGEVRGGPGNQVLGTVTANSAEELKEKLKALSDTLDRTDKKPVTPERLKEAGFEAEPVNVFNPADESVNRYEARTAQFPHYCGNCIAHRQEKFDGEIIHVCMRHKVWLHNQERWDGGCDAWEPSPAICKLYKEWADGFCSSCKYFEPEEPGQKRGMGLCARNDEIKMMGQSCAGYARKGELPKYLERQPMEIPEPLGTITTH